MHGQRGQQSWGLRAPVRTGGPMALQPCSACTRLSSSSGSTWGGAPHFQKRSPWLVQRDWGHPGSPICVLCHIPVPVPVRGYHVAHRSRQPGCMGSPPSWQDAGRVHLSGLQR